LGAGVAYITIMGHKRRARMQLDEVLTDVFAGLVIAALIAGVISNPYVN
jgi:hypothetical protein